MCSHRNSTTVAPCKLCAHERTIADLQQQLTEANRQNKELAYDRAHMDSLRIKIAELYGKNKELREAVIDYIANLTADAARKSCGHEFQCVCSGDRLDKALSGGG
jgi:hypothetical protein